MSDLLKILIIDDNPDDRYLIRHELNKCFVVDIIDITDEKELENALKKNDFDIVITDYKLNWSTGLDILLKIKSKNSLIPVIMFTGTGDEEIAVQAMKFGLNDYIIKNPKHYNRIPIAVNKILDSIKEKQEKDRINAKLTEEKEKSRRLMENAVIGYYSTNKKGEILYANKTLIKMLGYDTLEQLQKRNLLEKGFDKDFPRLDFEEKINSRGEINGYESVWIKKDGKRLFVRENAKVIKNEEDGTLFYEGSIENISDLKESKRLIKSLLDIAKASIEKPSLKEFYAFLVEEIRKSLNFDSIIIARIDEKSGKLFLDYSNEYTDLVEREMFSKNSIYYHLLNNGNSLLIDDIEADELSKQGVLFRQTFFQWMGAKIKINNEVTGVLALINKTSPDSYSPEYLKVLEYFSSQIGLLIEKKRKTQQLITANILAEESEKLKSSFLANLSHELRTPLNGILGFAEIILENVSKDEDINKYSSFIYENSMQLHSILDNIIELSQIETSQIDLSYSSFKLNTFLDNIFYNFIETHQKKGVFYQYEKDTNSPNVIIEGDRAKIERCILALLDNAYKYTDKGKVILSFFVGEDFVELCISDTGKGISKKNQKMIFDKFVSLGEPLKAENRGTGIGLTLCDKIIKLHKGDIWVESELGVGTSMHFRLPYNIDRKKKHEDIYPNWDNKTLLVIEEEERNYQLIETYLYKTGCRLLWAKDKENALKIFLKESSIDIVVIEIHTPQTEWMTVIEKVREIDKKTPIIAIISHANEEISLRLNKADCNDNISKPIRRLSLLRVIEKNIR